MDNQFGAAVRKAPAVAVVISLMMSLAACTMPRPIASYGEIRSANKQGRIALLPLTERTLPAAPAGPARSIASVFVSSPEVNVDYVGPGDRFELRIWEQGSPGIFGQSGGLANIGEVSVDQSGDLYIPYVGSVRVTGLTIPQIRSRILSRLRTVVALPQVDIRPLEVRSRLVAVQGAVSKGGSFPIERGRTRLGQLLGEVIASQVNPEMVQVEIRRDGNSVALRLSDIYEDPTLDVALQPGDSIVVSDVVETITVLGATGEQKSIQIPRRGFTLMDTLGEAKGLSSDTADPRAVFVLRSTANAPGPPLVYHVDMTRPETIALANQFVIASGDVILVSSSSFAQTRQMLTSIAQAMTIGRGAATIFP